MYKQTVFESPGIILNWFSNPWGYCCLTLMISLGKKIDSIELISNE